MDKKQNNTLKVITIGIVVYIVLIIINTMLKQAFFRYLFNSGFQLEFNSQQAALIRGYFDHSPKLFLLLLGFLVGKLAHKNKIKSSLYFGLMLSLFYFVLLFIGTVVLSAIYPRIQQLGVGLVLSTYGKKGLIALPMVVGLTTFGGWVASKHSNKINSRT